MPGPPRGGGLPDASEYQVPEVDSSSTQSSHRAATGSSVLDNGAIEEFGRTYHHYKAETYLLPNDAEEQDRLDLQHQVALLRLDDRLHWAPIENPRQALDVGTGTGIWAIGFAKQYPECEVTGSDLSLIQPKDLGTVSNCHFIREDADDDEWTYNQLFDYIHFRFFCAFVTDIRQVVQKAFDHLEPGGWMEFQEATHEIACSDGSLEGTAMQKSSQILTSMTAAHGRDPWAMGKLKGLLSEVGFVDVSETIMPVPIGPWAADRKLREIGWWHGVNSKKALESIIKLIIKSGMTTSEAEDLVATAKLEIDGGKVHGYLLMYVVYGRKPVAATAEPTTSIV